MRGRGRRARALTFYSKLSGVTTDGPNRLLPRIDVHSHKKLLTTPSRKEGRKEGLLQWLTGCGQIRLEGTIPFTCLVCASL